MSRSPWGPPHTEERHVDDQTRLRLLPRFEELFGAEGAQAVMAEFADRNWQDVATRSDVRESGAALRVDMAELGSELRGEMAELRSELRGEMAELRSELRGEMAELRGDLAKLDGRVTGLQFHVEALLSGIRVEMHQSIRNQTWALVGWSTALAGIAVALAR